MASCDINRWPVKILMAGQLAYYFAHNAWVTPLCPEPILNQDGSKKQDSEMKSSKRWIGKFRKEHPKLRVIVVEDALSANAPHIRTLRKHDLSYVIGVKEKGSKFLFDQFAVNEKTI